MIGRRGFLGALAGLVTVGAVAPQPNVTVGPPRIPIIDETHRQLKARIIAPAEVRQREGLVINITCDTTEFQREVARAQRTINAVERRLERALYRGIKVERG